MLNEILALGGSIVSFAMSLFYIGVTVIIAYMTYDLFRMIRKERKASTNKKESITSQTDLPAG